ncbi:Kp4-domain-containing protein [Mycena latifolia]|nr:Kp4-domain-containing protein [Mycena latifolia]
MALSLVSLVIIASVRTLALGTNCDGNPKCAKDGSPMMLRDAINTIDDFIWYENGLHISCTPTHVCAFLQNSGGLGAGDIKPLADAIVTHGCQGCGSAPFLDSGNNVALGELTFNWVSDINGCDMGVLDENAVHGLFTDRQIAPL